MQEGKINFFAVLENNCINDDHDHKNFDQLKDGF